VSDRRSRGAARRVSPGIHVINTRTTPPTGSGAAHSRENATELATPCAGRIGTLGEGLSETRRQVRRRMCALDVSVPLIADALRRTWRIERRALRGLPTRTTCYGHCAIWWPRLSAA
jgi:hypothetical protein